LRKYPERIENECIFLSAIYCCFLRMMKNDYLRVANGMWAMARKIAFWP
jgi:hypothetical protein